ncbi:DUF3048 domain-containing protein [Paenibacillus sabuli]|uniref:DUF3048 domain-containing protein n=1 Tax=Paenibacillus sabuli TaxID=2772509 RepID=UPI00295BA165|nr:DUF3048 domain-containing protein [Paenibacillus sabuli]
MKERNAGRRLLWLLAIGIVLLLGVAGCAGGSAPAEEPPAEEVIEPIVPEEPPKPEPEPEPDPGPAYTAPLTGIGRETEATVRPMAVMVNNYSTARPQSGLPHADVVWEVLAEGGITRLVAIFQSDAFEDPIGPIRSIRPYLIELGEMYHSVLAHAGASNDGYAILQRERKPHLDEISNAGAYFWRESFRKAPHNLYSNLQKLRDGADARGYDTDVDIPALPFLTADETVQGEPATTLEIKFLLDNYQVSYTYDADEGLYLREVNGEPHTDLTTEAQLSASNLVVLGADHRTLDDVGRLAIDLSSGGPAVLLRQGKAVEAKWTRPEDGGPIRIVDESGEELPLVPGQTFYHIVPLSGSFDSHFAYE